MFKFVVVFLVFLLALTQAHITQSNSIHIKRDEAQANSVALIDFSVDNVSIAATGRIICLNGSETQSGEDSLSVEITVDSAYFLTSFAIYINDVGASQYITVEQWGYVEVNSTNGYTFRQCEQKTNSYTFLVPFSTLFNVTGADCYDVQVAIDLKQFCGSYTSLEAISYSPPGCDTEFELYSPAPESYALAVFQQNSTAEAWCVKPGFYIEANTPYVGRLLSTYDEEVLGSTPGQYVARPDNLDLINYVFNNEEKYYGLSFANSTGDQCTWQDVQNAVWILIDPETIANNRSLLLTPSSDTCVNAIVEDAQANGNGYIPACPGGKYLVLIVAVDRDCRANCSQLDDVQVTGFVQGGPCLNLCNLTYCKYPNVRASANFCDCAAPSPSISSAPVLPSTTSSSSPSSSVSLSPSNSPTSCPSFTSAASNTPSNSPTSCPSFTATASATSAASLSSTSLPSASSTSAPSVTSTSLPSASSTSAPSESSSPSASISTIPSITSAPALPSDSPTSSASVTSTSAPSASSTSAPSASSTSLPSASSTSAPSVTSTSTPSQTATNSISLSSSNSPTSCPSFTSTASNTPSNSPTSCPSFTSTATNTPSNSPTSCPSFTSTATSSASTIPSITSAPVLPSSSPSATSTSTTSRTNTATRTPCPSRSERPSESNRPSCSSPPSQSSCRSASSSPSKSQPHCPSQSPSKSQPHCPSQSPSASPPCRQSSTPTRAPVPARKH